MIAHRIHDPAAEAESIRSFSGGVSIANLSLSLRSLWCWQFSWPAETVAVL